MKNSGKTINSSGCPSGFALGTSLGIYRLSFVFYIRLLYTLTVYILDIAWQWRYSLTWRYSLIVNLKSNKGDTDIQCRYTKIVEIYCDNAVKEKRGGYTLRVQIKANSRDKFIQWRKKLWYSQTMQMKSTVNIMRK